MFGHTRTVTADENGEISLSADTARLRATPKSPMTFSLRIVFFFFVSAFIRNTHSIGHCTRSVTCDVCVLRRPPAIPTIHPHLNGRQMRAQLV